MSNRFKKVLAWVWLVVLFFLLINYGIPALLNVIDFIDTAFQRHPPY